MIHYILGKTTSEFVPYMTMGSCALLSAALTFFFLPETKGTVLPGTIEEAVQLKPYLAHRRRCKQRKVAIVSEEMATLKGEAVWSALATDRNTKLYNISISLWFSFFHHKFRLALQRQETRAYVVVAIVTFERLFQSLFGFLPLFNKASHSSGEYKRICLRVVTYSQQWKRRRRVLRPI